MKRLSHPFISELKRYVANRNTSLGPVVLSLSELIEPWACKIGNLDRDKAQKTVEHVRGLQKKLSEVTDMVHAAHVFHRCVKDKIFQTSVEDQPTPAAEQAKTAKILQQDNIMSLLLGDYLLAQSSVDIADLRYPKTVGLIAKGLEDYTRGEFLKLKLFENHRGETSKHSQDELRIGLEKYAELTCGSLLSTSCLSAILLAGYPDIQLDVKTKNDESSANRFDTDDANLSRAAFDFGFHTGTAHRLIEFLYCPDTNSEDDQQFLKVLDVKSFTDSIRSHLDKAAKLLVSLPDGEKRLSLLELLANMRNRCSNK